MVPVPHWDIGGPLVAAEVTNPPQGSPWPALFPRPFPTATLRDLSQLTPSFFCRLDDEVVYWNTSRLSG